MKENLEISSNKLEVMIKRKLGVVLDSFVLKEQKQDINKNAKEMLRRQHKRLIKMKRDKYKDDQEVGTTFMITTAAAVREVCVVEGDRARERAEADYKGNIEKSQAASDRAKKNQNGNDEGDSGGEDEDDVAPSSGNRGRGRGSGRDSNMVESKI